MDDIPETLKAAFSAGFMNTVENAVAKKGFGLHVYRQRCQDLLPGWLEAFQAIENDTRQKTRFGLSIANALDPDSGIVESTGLLIILDGKIKVLRASLRAGLQLDFSEDEETADSSKSGCLTVIVLAVATTYVVWF